MTKNSYSKRAIRTRMEETGEAYSVAARAIADAYLSSGWDELDSLLEGGFRPGSFSVVVSTATNPREQLDGLMVSLTKPNRRVLYITDKKLEELTGDEPRLNAHLERNLALRRAGSSWMEDGSSEAILEELRSGSFGAVLLDLDSSGFRHWAGIKDGWRFAAELKSSSIELAIPLVGYRNAQRDHPASLINGYRVLSDYIAGSADAIGLISKGVEEESLSFSLAKNRFGPTSKS